MVCISVSSGEASGVGFGKVSGSFLSTEIAYLVFKRGNLDVSSMISQSLRFHANSEVYVKNISKLSKLSNFGFGSNLRCKQK